MDKLGANFEYSVSTLHDRLQNAAPIQLPWCEDEFEAIIDLVEMKCLIYQRLRYRNSMKLKFLKITKKELKKLVQLIEAVRNNDELMENILVTKKFHRELKCNPSSNY